MTYVQFQNRSAIVLVPTKLWVPLLQFTKHIEYDFLAHSLLPSSDCFVRGRSNAVQFNVHDIVVRIVATINNRFRVVFFFFILATNPLRLSLRYV